MSVSKGEGSGGVRIDGLGPLNYCIENDYHFGRRKRYDVAPMCELT